MSNKAFILIKPSAFTKNVVYDLVPQVLDKNGIKIIRSGFFTPEEMSKKIDGHYSSISHHAMSFDKNSVSLIAQKAFHAAFGGNWDEAHITGVDSNYKVEDWRNLEKLGQTAKLEDGLYCGSLGNHRFIVNGFYPAMRRQYTDGGNACWFEVEFEMDYTTFKNDIIGATNPYVANPTSLRGILFDSWSNLGLKTRPSIGENGIHGSASAEDAKMELANWL